MKKILSLLAAAFMLLAAGCSQSVNSPVPTDESIILPRQITVLIHIS